jgi:hypothetical protein
MKTTINAFYNQFLEWVYGQIANAINDLPVFLQQLIEVNQRVSFFRLLIFNRNMDQRPLWIILIMSPEDIPLKDFLTK